MEGRVTLQTIADVVGVGKMTVSNAYSRPRHVSAGVRERILEVADELGYAGPDAAGRALARRRTGLVGVLLTSCAGRGVREPRGAGLRERDRARADAAVALARAALRPRAGRPGAGRPTSRWTGSSSTRACPTTPPSRTLVKRRLPMVLVDQPPRPGHQLGQHRRRGRRRAGGAARRRARPSRRRDRRAVGRRAARGRRLRSRRASRTASCATGCAAGAGCSPTRAPPRR